MLENRSLLLKLISTLTLPLALRSKEISIILLTTSKSDEKYTFNTSATILQHPRVHLRSGLGQQLVSCQVRVVRRSNEVVTKGLVHVLMHFTVQRIKYITRGTAHEAGETLEKTETFLL